MSNAISPTRQENYPEWYQEVVKAAELAEHSPTRGSMVIKPWGYALWELMQKGLDGLIKETGHENVAMPTLLPLEFFEKEAEHVEGFAKETMVMTHYRLKLDDKGALIPDPESALEKPYVLRPTSELMFGHMYSKWVQSYRDLPILLNQWGSVFRWEMRTRLFLRTAEFIWQEGHTAHATEQEACDETSLMHQTYNTFLRDFLAVASIPGYKTPDELFPGAIHTLTLESMMQDKKALQAATSHYLGQNFAKASDIQFLDQNGDRQYAHTTSWGASTRMVGGLIMSHSDDDGLVLPPRVAPSQVVILPIYRKDEEREQVLAAANDLVKQLKASNAFGESVRVKIDDRDLRGGEKSWQAIKKGVPVRIEIGPRDLAKNQVCLARRDKGPKEKEFLAIDAAVTAIPAILEEMQANLLAASEARLEENTQFIEDLDSFKAFFENDGGFAVAYWSEAAIDHPILSELKVTPRCIPLEGQTEEEHTCIFSGEKTSTKVVFAKSY